MKSAANVMLGLLCLFANGVLESALASDFGLGQGAGNRPAIQERQQHTPAIPQLLLDGGLGPIPPRINKPSPDMQVPREVPPSNLQSIPPDYFRPGTLTLPTDRNRVVSLKAIEEANDYLLEAISRLLAGGTICRIQLDDYKTSEAKVSTRTAEEITRQRALFLKFITTKENCP